LLDELDDVFRSFATEWTSSLRAKKWDLTGQTR
jgi:hypothetical protein